MQNKGIVRVINVDNTIKITLKTLADKNEQMRISFETNAEKRVKDRQINRKLKSVKSPFFI